MRSRRPPCSPECSTTSPRRNPVGGRKESEKRASWRRSAGCRRASRKASASETPVWIPHTGRLSTTTETRISACSCVGSSSQLCAARRQDASERTSSGLAAVVPFASTSQAARHEALVDAAADGQRVVERSRGPCPRRATPPRCRRRSPEAPRAARGCRAPATRTASAPRRRLATASSIRRRIERVHDDRVDPREVQRRRPRTMQRDDGRAQVARRLGELARSSTRARSRPAGGTRSASPRRRGRRPPRHRAPRRSPRATGKWRMPRSSMSSHTSLPSRSAATV